MKNFGLTVGSIVIKTRGSKVGQIAVVTKLMDNAFFEIIGPWGKENFPVRLGRCNIKHLEVMRNEDGAIKLDIVSYNKKVDGSFSNYEKKIFDEMKNNPVTKKLLDAQIMKLAKFRGVPDGKSKRRRYMDDNDTWISQR